MDEQKRTGNTVVTSVSLSKEFKKFMDDYNISPTNAVRKGVAVELFERGLPQYKTETNAKRYNDLKELMKQERMLDFPAKLKEVEDMIKEIRLVLEETK